jgi:hypothetical protein
MNIRFAAFLASIALAAGVTTALPRVDPRVHRTLALQGAVDLIVTLKATTKSTLESIREEDYSSRADLIAALKAKLEAQNKVASAAVETLLLLQSIGPLRLHAGFKTFWISNQIFIQSASLKLINKLLLLPSVAEITEELVITLDQNQAESDKAPTLSDSAVSSTAPPPSDDNEELQHKTSGDNVRGARALNDEAEQVLGNLVGSVVQGVSTLLPTTTSAPPTEAPQDGEDEETIRRRCQLLGNCYRRTRELNDEAEQSLGTLLEPVLETVLPVLATPTPAPSSETPTTGSQDEEDEETIRRRCDALGNCYRRTRALAGKKRQKRQKHDRSHGKCDDDSSAVPESDSSVESNEVPEGDEIFDTARRRCTSARNCFRRARELKGAVGLPVLDDLDLIGCAWGIERIGAPKVWADGNTGQGVIVASIDSGVRSTHEALRGNFRGAYGWYDPEAEEPLPYDRSGHGTHTMGTIAGAKGIGVAPGVTWMTCKGCRTDKCTQSELLACAQFILCPTDTQGNNADCSKAPRVVNNSWGGGQGGTFYKAAVDAWVKAGIIPVFGNGNSGSACGTANSPGDYSNVVAVGATNLLDGLASYSSKGPSVNGLLKPDISAPGDSIRSAWNESDTKYSTISGTSMAAPHVTGSIALLLAAQPDLSIDEIKTTLYKTTKQFGMLPTLATCGGTSDLEWPNNQYGHGRLNVFNAYEAEF